MERPLKVLHVLKYFRPDFTGEGTFLERIAPVFRTLQPGVGHDVLCTLTGNPDDKPELLDGLGSVEYLGPRDRKSFQSFVDQFRWSFGNLARYDVVHYHSHVDRTFASYFLAALLGKRLVLSATLDDSPLGIAKTYRPLFRPIVRRLLRCFDAFVSISPKLHDETVGEMGAARAHLIPMGIRIPSVTGDRALARSNLGLPQDAHVLVSVGGICERKDQMTLVQALSPLVANFPDLILVLVGPVLEPAYAEALERKINEAGLQKHVRFAGWVREPWSYYSAADVMVFASQEEGFGTVMIEAMAYAIPVVARHLKGVNDLFIEHGRTGFLFGSTEQYQLFVSKLLSDAVERRLLGNAARASIVPRYAMEKIAERYLAVYGYPARKG